MPTILQINTVINTTSIGRIAEEIGQLVISKGWRSLIAYGRRPRQSQSELIRVGTNWDNLLHGLATRFFDRHGLASRQATRELVKQIELIKPDLIHLHNIHGYYLNYPLLFEYLSRINIPVVWTLHDCWAVTGHCSYFSFINCNRWKQQCYDCPQKRSYPSCFLFDCSKENYIKKRNAFTLPENLTIVCVSDWLQGVMKESYLSKYPILRIYNGIDLDLFTPGEKRSKKLKITLLGIANVWDSRKGLTDFFHLRELLPKDNYDIVLVGLSKSQLRHLPEGIKGISRTENIQRLVDLYRDATIFVNLTKEDCFPTTNLEALACGIPVITYKTGGSIEAVDSETGIIVDQGDLNGIIDAIRELSQRDQVRLSRDCRQRAINYYNKKKRFQEYFDLYTMLIKE